jgi:sarcosine oxidase delta subunit
MKNLISMALIALPLSVEAHECSKFLTSGWPADEGYACNVIASDLERMRLHRMEVCIGSVPYLDNKRYANAEYKWVSLAQYNNPYNQADGSHNKFFDVFYTGLTYEGEDGERDYVKNSDVLYFQTFREGSTITHEFDFKAEVHLNLKNGRGNLTSYNREPSLLFKKKWQKSIQVSFDCERIR